MMVPYGAWQTVSAVTECGRNGGRERGRKKGAPHLKMPEVEPNSAAADDKPCFSLNSSREPIL